MTSLADQLWEDAGAPLCKEMYGVPVTLTRGGVVSSSITAIADSVDYQLFDNEGLMTVFTARNYTLPVSETEIAGTAVEPRPGDVITETINGVEHQYEIMPVGKLAAVTLEPDGTDWTVHTKRVA